MTWAEIDNFLCLKYLKTAISAKNPPDMIRIGLNAPNKGRTYIFCIAMAGSMKNVNAKMPDEIMAENHQSDFITTARNEGSLRDFARFFAIVYQSTLTDHCGWNHR